MTVKEGPAIESNGLILNFDSANSNKSYSGDTTTNLITNNPLPTAGSTTGYSAQGGTGSAISYDTNKEAIFWQRNTYEPWGAFIPNETIFNGTLSTSSQYTASFEWYSESEYDNSKYVWNLVRNDGVNQASPSVNVVSNSTSIGGGWYRFSYSFTPANTGDSAKFRVIVASQGLLKTRFWWRKLQLEQKSYRTTFTQGTRTASVLDTSGSGNNSSSTSQLTYDSSNYGSFSFNGTGSYIEIPPANFDLSEFSISMWAKFANVTSDYVRLIHKADTSSATKGFIIATSATDGKLVFGYQPNYTTGEILKRSTTILSPNVFYNIVMTYGSVSGVKIYFNGVEDAGETSTNPDVGWVSGAGNYFSIGSRADKAMQFFNGNISQVLIYNRVFSAPEVSQNFNALRGRYGI